jgi:hypothetical protein
MVSVSSWQLVDLHSHRGELSDHNLPAGEFRFTVGTATAVNAEVIRIPT